MKLSRSEAYPAQLEQILKARGLDAEVVNAGVSGDTTAGMLNRIDSDVPAGTALVIIQPGSNDGRGGRRQGGRLVDPASTRANLEQIVSRLQARGVSVAMFNGFGGVGREVAAERHAVFLGAVFAGIPASDFQPDGQHLTAEGNAALAARIAPKIVAVLRSGRGR